MPSGERAWPARRGRSPPPPGKKERDMNMSACVRGDKTSDAEEVGSASPIRTCVVDDESVIEWHRSFQLFGLRVQSCEVGVTGTYV